MTEEEKKIIEGCQAGKTRYQKMLYDQYGPDVKAVCMRYAESEAEGLDLFHDIFVHILTHFKEYDKIYTLGGWLHTITVNKCTDFCRRKKRYQLETITSNQDVIPCEDGKYGDILTAQQILAFVNTLSEKQRVAFNLYEVDGLPESEIVKIMDETPTNVRTLISRAKSTLRDKIRKYLRNEEFDM